MSDLQLGSGMGAEQLLLEVTTSRSRRVRNGIATFWMYVSFVLVVVPLAFIVGYVVQKGASQMSGAWFTQRLPAVSTKPGGGMQPAIVGTLVITFGAAVMAVPLGVLGA